MPPLNLHQPRLPMTVVIVDTKTATLKRYSGKHCTHKAQLLGGLSANNTVDILQFRKYPDSSMQYYPEGA